MPRRTFAPSLDRTVTSMSSPIMMLCLVFRVRTSTSLSSSTRPEFLPPPGYGFDLGCQRDRVPADLE
jgi:hypothetical protein